MKMIFIFTAMETDEQFSKRYIFAKIEITIVAY